ncbi:TP53-regulated inhibitor of apoptosis 1 [Agrilus planipennis]|uniref:TP53-regulated inhibitor of apoptosis 1 n=1 Tax=Agrilus planipennis TaxID=224129 RepID=A0A1W4XEP7_AGRPL|nr:TP53-regulated inhibitor of apoptosis 1 [Agrilus planipennis]
MNSIGTACNDLKKEYDTCFNTWFAEHFLKGNSDDSMCAPMLKIYKECVKKAMKERQIDVKEVEKDILGTENERKIPEQQGR